MDDNLIETDKIGAGNFLWALKSKALQQRNNLLDDLAEEKRKLDQQRQDLHINIENESALDTEERADALANLAILKKQNEALKEAASNYQDPDDYERIKD